MVNDIKEKVKSVENSENKTRLEARTKARPEVEFGSDSEQNLSGSGSRQNLSGSDSGQKEKEIKKPDKSIEEKKKELLEKVKKLKKKIDVPSSEELKEKVKIKKKGNMLVPLEEYVRAGIYLGTKVVTPTMKHFVYRRRADGLAIFNTDLIDEKLKQGIEYLSKFNAKDIIVACKREAGWKAVKKFGELTGIKVFAKKYPAGILTNTTLPDFFENKLTIVCDSWLDRNALNDTIKVHKKVLMICDTNNFSKGADQFIIGNNKSAKSLGLIFYILARGFMRAKKMDTLKIPDLDWWTSEDENIQKKIKKRF